MANQLTWVTYLDRLPGGPTDRQIAAAAETNPSTVTRWRKGQEPNPRHVVQVARQFNMHPITALIAAGYLNSDEVDALLGLAGASDHFSLGSTPTVALLEEATRRLKEESGD